MQEQIIIGIDLGTRYSCCSIWRNKRLEIIPDEYGNRTVASAVSFYKSIRLIGSDALTMKTVDPKNCIYDVKRIIGCKYTDPLLDGSKKFLTYDIIDDETDHHNIMIQLTIAGKNLFRPEEISAMILSKLKNNAEKYLGVPITDAVITVPAYFNDSQRQATLDSAQIAGLNVMRMVNEPTAAALAYGMGNAQGNIIVYDLGAGTLDVSLLNITNGTFQVLAVTGNTFLGGEDFDYRLVNFSIIEFKKNHSISGEIEISKLSYMKLKASCENAKKILSTNEKAIIIVDDFHDGKKLYQIVTRDDFDRLCNDLFTLCIKCLHDVLESANMTRSSIDDLVLVGGSTRIPKIQQLLLDFFKCDSTSKVIQLNSSMNPDEVVAAGAAIYGYILSHKDDPFSENLVLLDITPLSLGVETLQRQMTTIIPRNTVIPTRKTKTFSTDTDNQTSVIIKVFEGERRLTKDNYLLGTFELSNFEAAPRGCPVIKLILQIDINGILHVTAVEKKSDAQNTININSIWGAKGRLSRDEIDALVKEAVANDTQDKIYSKKVEYAYQIDDLCQNVLTNLKSDSFKLTAVDKKKIKLDIKNTLQWMTSQDIIVTKLDEYKKILERLNSIYGPLILKVNKEEDKFEGMSDNSLGTKIHGDDDDKSTHSTYQAVTIVPPSNELEREELKKMKNNIMDLCESISNMIHNPVTLLTKDDMTILTDYIDSVLLWICATDTSNMNDYVAKVNEINRFTDEIMCKYDTIFDTKNTLSAADELELLCISLHSSIKSNYFSMKENDIKLLTHKIEECMLWVSGNVGITNEECVFKISEINYICNQIYQNMSLLKMTPTVVPSDANEIFDSDDSDKSSPVSHMINENINDIVNRMPDLLDVESEDTETLVPVVHTNDVYLRVDFSKFVPNVPIHDEDLRMLKG
jgi:heat shock protein 1/8